MTEPLREALRSLWSDVLGVIPHRLWEKHKVAVAEALAAPVTEVLTERLRAFIGNYTHSWEPGWMTEEDIDRKVAELTGRDGGGE